MEITVDKMNNKCQSCCVSKLISTHWRLTIQFLENEILREMSSSTIFSPASIFLVNSTTSLATASKSRLRTAFEGPDGDEKLVNEGGMKLLNDDVLLQIGIISASGWFSILLTFFPLAGFDSWFPNSKSFKEKSSARSFSLLLCEQILVQI